MFESSQIMSVFSDCLRVSGTLEDLIIGKGLLLGLYKLTLVGCILRWTVGDEALQWRKKRDGEVSY